MESSRAGISVSKQRLQQIVEEARMAIGLTETVEIVDPETGEGHQECVQMYSIMTYDTPPQFLYIMQKALPAILSLGRKFRPHLAIKTFRLR